MSRTEPTTKVPGFWCKVATQLVRAFIKPFTTTGSAPSKSSSNDALQHSSGVSHIPPIQNAPAPYQVEQQALAARKRVLDTVVGFEKLAFATLGAEAIAAAEGAVRSFVDSGAVDGVDSLLATIEARRVRDGALEPFQQAAEAQRAARRVENAIMLKSYEARSRASELLGAAGINDYSAVEPIVARAIELARGRVSQLDPAVGMFVLDAQIGEILLAAVDEAMREAT